VSSARFGIGQPTVLPVQLALELSERRENPEHQPAAGGRGVDIGALPGQDCMTTALAPLKVDKLII
jgi:hypothetical protein